MWLEDILSHTLNRFLAHTAAPVSAGLVMGFAVEPPHARSIWPDSQRCEHAVILGKTGTGKTHLLEYLAWQLATRGEGFSFFDFHGDASLSLIGRLSGLPASTKRLVIVDPSHPTRSPGINVLASGGDESTRFRKVSELSSILRQRWGVDAFGARTEELLRNSLYTLAATDGTLADLPRLLTDRTFRDARTQRIEHPDIAAYWTDRYEPLSEAMKAAFREPLLNRVTAFLTEPAARHLLCQRHSTIDMAAAMARGQWLIVRLPKGRLREHAHTLGNLLFAQLQFAALAREGIAQEARKTFTLVCDEVQNLAENDLATLLTEGRKFGISVVTANQFWEQLSKELRGALLSAASHICFRVSSQDAHILAAELGPERRSRLSIELTQLARGEAIGRFGTRALSRFRVPPIPAVPRVTAEAFDRLIEPVTRARSEIEADTRRPVHAGTPRPPVGRVNANEANEGQHDW
ncbi:MAG TPA: type IV secretion system DNA-binding domain-containing protein [Vicinamibacterales bacterium]|nr:type IV secretion system DNA-binding domain-containing protein [Vicinamibacterales bacterium]